MLNSSVLVLNRSYLPIHVTSARRAFTLIYQGIAKVIDDQYKTFDFESWSQLAVAASEEAIGTPHGPIRIPRVIVLVAFDRLPRRHVRFSRINLMARDDFQCQYCGIKPKRAELNLDHVIPRALGGKSTWENVVTSCIDCNRQKGGRTPGTGEYVDDSVITTKVKSMLAADDFLKSFEISVQTYKGIVQLSGFVDSQKAVDKAGEVARGVGGVKSVTNNLNVKKSRRPLSFPGRSLEAGVDPNPGFPRNPRGKHSSDQLQRKSRSSCLESFAGQNFYDPFVGPGMEIKGRIFP